ncbi:hypothetical protein [Thalassobacillus pellis]|uniref:hypothetical protein n=1 Tax=Thalassobacillus pellis TaxID=748008 RepID=UPI00195FDB07|nr:hypothetical protein [Thalassobacillus pellis]MBM7554533.1 hypothetical protein [Thalassobacillus pellis]
MGEFVPDDVLMSMPGTDEDGNCTHLETTLDFVTGVETCEGEGCPKVWGAWD